MAHLVRAACVLKFEEHELIEFFGVATALDEDSCSYTFSLSRDGLRLECAVFPLDGSVRTAIYRDGLSFPVLSSQLTGCTLARVVELAPGLRCLEVGRQEQTSPSLASGIRLIVEPQFRLEFVP
jgi:hypothetical protein